MKVQRTVLVAALALLTAVVPALAHHSFSAEYDATKQITVKGKFTKMEWVNPHSWVHLDVAGSDGKVVSWGCETPPPNNLYRQGWRKDALKVGEEIEVRGYAAKDGSPTMWAQVVTVVATEQRVFNGPAPQ